MSYGNEYPLERGYDASSSFTTERAAFIRRTYAHLAAALMALIGIEFVLLSVKGLDLQVLRAMTLNGSPWGFLIVFVGFIVLGTLAQNWAASQTSRGMQYLGLSVYVLLEAVILFPLLAVVKWYGEMKGDHSLIPTAGILTLAVFAGLTAVVFITKKDFSFLGSILTLCSFAAIGFIIAALIFGFSLGMFFTAAMIVLMGGYILYDTSNVMHHYGTDQHVAAALALFASVATLFWYILRLLLILASSRE